MKKYCEHCGVKTAKHSKYFVINDLNKEIENVNNKYNRVLRIFQNFHQDEMGVFEGLSAILKKLTLEINHIDDWAKQYGDAQPVPEQLKSTVGSKTASPLENPTNMRHLFTVVSTLRNDVKETLDNLSSSQMKEHVDVKTTPLLELEKALTSSLKHIREKI
jgi:uncharacterized protein YdiU (UPF0061 family)